MHLAPLIRDLATILAVAAVVTLVFQRIRQPVVLGYIVAGFLIGPYILPHPLVSDIPNIKVWAELGVIFLMFSLGLEFSFRKLARVGLAAILTAWIEVPLMFACGYGLGRLVGWAPNDSIFLGAIISISSTTIIVKALDELRLKTRRFAELIFGVLIVEDLIAIVILMALSTLAGSSSVSGVDLLLSAGRLVLVIGSWFVVGYFLLPRFVRYVGKIGNEETLTILSLGLCLSLAVFAATQKYSVALGAFIMGSILAESSESNRILERLEPLRDLFGAIFFVSVGMLIDPQQILARPGSIAMVTLVLVVGKIVNITAGALIAGQTFRTSVQVGFGMAQIGEFSFIIATLGYAMGVISPFIYPVAVAASVITTFFTPYLIRVSHKAAVATEKRLPLRLKEFLTRYAAWAQERQATGRERREFHRRGMRWFLNGIVVTVVFVLMASVVVPWFSRGVRSPLLSVAGWVLAVLLSSPFLWAMFGAFRGFGTGRANAAATSSGETGTLTSLRIGDSTAGILLVSRIATLVWIAVLSRNFFSLGLAVAIGGLLVLGFLFYFRRQVSESYQWFEGRFLSTFADSAKTRRQTDVLRHLAPWDAHLVRFKVHPNSEIAGLELKEIQLRERYGLSVVVIQRGLRTIVAPAPVERVFPKDELLVLGTDEQVEAARRAIEKPPGLAERFRDLSGYELRRVPVAEKSELVGRMIRQSGIRERSGGMVVGIERKGGRVINPSSDTVLVAGDVLWIVGDADKLVGLR